MMMILNEKTLNKIKELIQEETDTKLDFDVYIKPKGNITEVECSNYSCKHHGDASKCNSKKIHIGVMGCITYRK